eukprot:5686502-Pyramimonas_sp.AAC.1
MSCIRRTMPSAAARFTTSHWSWVPRRSRIFASVSCSDTPHWSMDSLLSARQRRSQPTGPSLRRSRNLVHHSA